MIDVDRIGTKDYDYDQWLDFFRKCSYQEIEESVEELKRILPADGYAALMRWLEIFKNPSKMDKLYKGRLDKDSEDSIMELAVGDDDEDFYQALIRENVRQMNSSSVSSQEVARLSQNISIYRKELREIRSRKPKTGTILEKVIKRAENKSNPVKSTSVKSEKGRSEALESTKKKKTTNNTLKGRK